MTQNNIVKENKLIKSLIPKVSDYFQTREYLEKAQLTEFLNFIDLSTWNEKDKDKFWSEISKDRGKTSERVKKVLLIKNLTEYIHNHSKELFQPQESLKNSVMKFITNPKQIKVEIDPENELMFEFYRLLASIPLTDAKMIPIYTLDEKLKTFNFISLNKNTLLELIEELLKEKATSIKNEQYINIMEQMEKKFGPCLAQRSQAKKIFTDEDIDHPELSTFNDIIILNKILFTILDSLADSHEKACESESKKEKTKAEYFKKIFKIFINNSKLYLYEINRVYNEQKQKFDYFECSLVSKLTLYKQQINELQEELKKQKESEDARCKEALQAVNMELEEEKNQVGKLESNVKYLKKEKEGINEELIKAQNKITNLTKQIEERDNKINGLKKEIDMMSEKYKEIMATLNSQIFNEREKEKRNNDFIAKMNLNEKQKLLVNKNPQELLAYIVEKDKFCDSIEIKNKELSEKLSQIEENKEILENELYDYKSKVLSLENKNSNLVKENEDLQKVVEGNKNKSRPSFLLSAILENNEEESANTANANKNKTLVKVNTTQVSYKSVPQKIIKKEKKNDRNYDYLCIKMDDKIIQNLDDEYYNGTSDLMFSELIDYLDEEKEKTECILFITKSFLYLFNNVTYKKCFSIPIDELRNVFISTLNNYVSMTFEEGQIVNFELFRILELMNFLKTLNALHLIKQEININMSEFNNQFMKENARNFVVSPYYGRAIFSGHLDKRVEGVLKTGFEKRYVILTEIGLIVMESPTGNVLEIINLLFAKTNVYNGGDGEYCFNLIIGKDNYTFSSKTEFLRTKWITEIDNWIKKVQEEETISV